MSRDDVDLGDP